VWLPGTFLSAIALLCIAVTTATLQGKAAGWAILAMLTLFSLSRGLCSVPAKDVLGKTVSMARRGALMGYSAAAAGVVTLITGSYVELFGGRRLGADFFMAILLAAAGIWLLAIAAFALIREEAGATEGGGNAITTALRCLALMKTDQALRCFVIVRALLLSVALAPPFYVLLAQQRSAGVTGLGLMIVASGLAASLSAPIWGRMGDGSGRLVMVVASAAAGLTALLTLLLDTVGGPITNSPWTYALLFMLVAVFYSGVRLGRKVYLVDMATQDTRSTYVAVSNTVIGAAMLAGGTVGVLADHFRTSAILALLGLVSMLAAFYIARMPDVSG
jgi:Na+/melibiose symporter-like transporter